MLAHIARFVGKCRLTNDNPDAHQEGAACVHVVSPLAMYLRLARREKSASVLQACRVEFP
jgi:hypothetical protein